MRDIRGRKALVTGAASGIGRAIAIALAREGTDVCLVDIDNQGLEKTISKSRSFGVEVVGLTCDLTLRDEIVRVVEHVLNAWQRVEILVNNAGIGYQGPTEEMSSEQWDRLLAVNLIAPIHLTHALLPTLLAQPQAHILNVCSILGLLTTSKTTAYSTSKYGLVGFSEALRTEYRRTTLGVSAVCPGFVRTRIFRSSECPRGYKPVRSPPRSLTVSPDTVARRALMAIRKNQGTVVVSPLAHVLWRLKRFAPGVLGYLSRFDPRLERQSIDSH